MKKERIQVIDALRGFALAGIVIVHMVENYIGSLPPTDAMTAANQGVLDSIVEGFIFLFLRGKFFALFSFLFGLSFFIQMDSGAQKGNNFQVRFLWRLLLLLLIGALHHLFYRGDILTVYAVLGILLIPFYKMKPTWILSLTAMLFLGLGRYLIFIFHGSEAIFTDIEMSPEHPAIVNYFDTIKNGSLTEVFASNTNEGHFMKFDFQLGVFGRGYLTFGFFLLGLYLGKMKFFQNYKNHKKKLFKGLYISIGLFFLSMTLAGLLFSMSNQDGQRIPNFDNWTVMFALSAYDLSNIFMTFILIISFLLLFMKLKSERILLKFAPYGRMALTNYVLQTIIGTAILYGWGLGYIGTLRNVYTFGIGILIILIQIVFSRWWLHRYNYGPLEWLWRSLTHFKIFKLKKN